MKPTRKSFLLLLMISSFLSSCMSGNGSSAEATPTIRPIYTPVNTTATQIFENVVYDSNYLNKCRTEYPPVYSQQVGFQGIYPAKTTLAEALEIFGKFSEYRNFEDGREFYSYETFNFTVKNKIVEDIVTNPSRDTVLSLRDILREYGCPDLIMASALATGMSELVYNYTAFVYSNVGLRIGFYNYPVTFSESAVEAIYLQPVSPKAYLKIMSIDTESKLVSFDEAIVEK